MPRFLSYFLFLTFSVSLGLFPYSISWDSITWNTIKWDSSTLAHASEEGIPSLGRASELVKAYLVSDQKNFQPPVASGSGSDESYPAVARIGVQFVIKPGWHIYWKNSGEAALPTQIEWILPDGWETSELRWPAPYRFKERGDIVTFGYSKQALLFSDLYAPLEVPADDARVKISAKVSFLVCKDVCIPGQQTISREFPFTTALPKEPSGEYLMLEQAAKLTPIQLADNQTSVQVAPHPAEAVRAGQPFELRLNLSGYKASQRAALDENVQLFPDLNDDFEFGRPSLSNASETKQSDVVLPVTVNRRTQAGRYQISGILVVSGKLLGKEHDHSFSWKIPLEVKAGKALSPEHSPSEHGPSKHSASEQAPASTKDSLNPLTFRLKVPFKAEKNAESDATTEGTAEAGFASFSLIAAIASGFLAGLILNLMPCVLPIISIKVMSFIEQADRPKSEAIRSSLFFAAGILATFLVFALLVIALSKAGIQVGWGMQFQYPGFVLSMILVLLMLGLGFFGMYQVSIPFLGTANAATSEIKSSAAKHFFEGALVTLLSTPCTAPFLGTALVVALGRPSIITVAIFLSIGLGLALPYVLISSQPALRSMLPKPGAWMHSLKHGMGFMLLAAAIWLLGVLQQLSGSGATYALWLCLLLAFCLWAHRGLATSAMATASKRLLKLALLILLLAGAAYLWPKATVRNSTQPEAAKSSNLIQWQPYSEDLVTASLAQGNPVFIDFTAEWCITCKANEFLVIETNEIAQVMAEKNIIAVKADWTAGDEVVTKALKKYGGTGVPYYVFLRDKTAEPLILPSLLTKAILSEAFHR